jgi:hypothetical protein
MLLKINHIAIIIALLLNILTNIIGAAQGYEVYFYYFLEYKLGE